MTRFIRSGPPNGWYVKYHDFKTLEVVLVVSRWPIAASAHRLGLSTPEPTVRNSAA